jgi:hypothetical protein
MRRKRSLPTMGLSWPVGLLAWWRRATASETESATRLSTRETSLGQRRIFLETLKGWKYDGIGEDTLVLSATDVM